MKFNQSDIATDAVLDGMFAELAAKSTPGQRYPTAGKNGLFEMFNSRLRQDNYGQNAMGIQFHNRAPNRAPKFGFIRTAKQNRVKESNVAYVFRGLTAA
jgi:hypothetical protein